MDTIRTQDRGTASDVIIKGFSSIRTSGLDLVYSYYL
ncbi:uncharacterized protein METZ01_LOCUS169300 [marine metagenome]|uniref:Uncharacterized protein n=1 Tax=marine metagenome TaxID=408172 RepID=A0A382BRJ5_9ZZZZ